MPRVRSTKGSYLARTPPLSAQACEFGIGFLGPLLVKKKNEKLVSDQAPPKKVKKEKSETIPLPDQEIEKIKK